MSRHMSVTVKSPAPEDGRCTLCGQPSHLTFHHLVPKDLHDKRWVRGRYSIDALRNRGIWICRSCHDFLHRSFDERELAQRLDTVEKLRAEPAVAKHIAWASKQRRRI
jgi:5-methylcytosine-specific restriction endonuclease McrA